MGLLKMAFTTSIFCYHVGANDAGVVELVDALDLGSSGQPP